MKKILLASLLIASLTSIGQRADYLVYDAGKPVDPLRVPEAAVTDSLYSLEPSVANVIEELTRRIEALEAKTAFYQPTRYFNRNGEIESPSSNRRVWRDTLTPTTASGYVVPISTAGFTEVQQVYMTVMKNTASADTPIPSVKSLTMTELQVNLSASNNAVVSILGVNVLSGTPLVIPPSVAGLKLFVTVIGK